MAKVISGKLLLSKHVSRNDRILLINPPVEETRYSWRRWNQPVDLLKIGSLLRSKIGCRVDLLDFMKPEAQGRVREEWLPRDRRYYTVKSDRYPMRRFGQPYRLLNDWFASKKIDTGWRSPTQIWITSLCSYWYVTIAEMCRVVRQLLPDAQIVLLGQYARYRPKHACESCAADFVVSQPVDLKHETSASDLYGDQPPPFLALPLEPKIAVQQVKLALEHEIVDFTFFEEDICRDGGEPLTEIFTETRNLRKHLRYHIICGLNPDRVTPAIARVLADRQFVQLHFEEAEEGESLDLESYRRTRAYLSEAGTKMRSDKLSGFVWIGRPGDKLEKLIRRSFDVLSSFGSVILKPFTPVPGSPEHKMYESYLANIPHRDWSPHFFPFAELNGISRDEYHDLYRVAAFLNEKVRDRSFDLLNGSIGSQMLRESLRREAWKLESTQISIID